MIVYVAYIIFQLWSHTSLYQDTSENLSENRKYEHPLVQGRSRKIRSRKSSNNNGEYRSTVSPLQSPDITITIVRSNTFNSVAGPLSNSILNENENTTAHNLIDNEKYQNEEDEKEEEIPTMSLLVTIILLVTVTVVSLSSQK